MVRTFQPARVINLHEYNPGKYKELPAPPRWLFYTSGVVSVLSLLVIAGIVWYFNLLAPFMGDHPDGEIFEHGIYTVEPINKP